MYPCISKLRLNFSSETRNGNGNDETLSEEGETRLLTSSVFSFFPPGYTVAMASETMNAWHPAFMPDSTADPFRTESADMARSSPLLPEAPLETPKPEPALLPSHTELTGDSEAVHAPETDAEPLEEDTEHPEASDVHNVLSSSVEAEQDEWALDNGHTESVIPGSAPAPFSAKDHSPKKHLSTMSFARTVSEDVNWGEDDDVDPEWNIQSTDPDPFRGMAQSDRTNSFPVVPPAHSSVPSHVDGSLSHSQAEDIMNEVEQHEHRDLFSDHGDDVEADFFSGQQTSNAFLQEAQNESDEWFPDYGQSLGGDARQEAEEESEARYEEGLPLVHSTENGNETRQLQVSNHAAFLDENVDDEDDFFTQVGKSDDIHQSPPELERKSTMQIMDSMQFQPHEPIHQTIAEEDNMESSTSSSERATGREITDAAQVPIDPEAPVHDDFLPESGEVDLAAQWQAALAEDEFLPDDDDELLPDDEEPTSSGLDPATLFGDDDDGFLEDVDEQGGATDLFSQQTSPPIPAQARGPNGQAAGFNGISGLANGSRPSSSSANRYLPTGAGTPITPLVNNYAPSAPNFTDLSRAGTANPAISSPYASPAIGSFQPPPQRPDIPKAQSFASMSKGGYSSPYDLPMEVVKPKKRASATHMNHGYAAAPPVNAPPRSISAFAPPPPPSMQPPPVISHGLPQTQVQQPPAKVVRKSQSGFFEDLPISTKPKPAARHSTGYGSPVPSLYIPPASEPPLPSAPPAATRYAAPPVQQHPVQPPHPSGLVAPERVSPYASLPTTSVPAPPVASRYSPAPTLQQTQTAPPPSQSRYSPAPPPSLPHAQSYSQPPVSAPPPTSVQHAQSYSNAYSSPILPHQPRTSSPLAHFERTQGTRQFSSQSENADRRSSSSGYDSSLQPHHLPPTREVDENEQVSPPSAKNYGDLQNQYTPPPMAQAAFAARSVTPTPPPPQGLASRLVNSPPKRVQSNYAPQQSAVGPPQGFAPPVRSQTQSPGSLFAGSRNELSTSEPYKRPASVEIPTSPRESVRYPSAPTLTTRPRGFSQGYNYIAPTDGREQDPLQRWKGAPVFAWGVGGTIMTSFPQDVPRYGMNQTAPMIIRSPGEVKIRNIKDLDPLAQRLATFPGPLKGKSKKKEVVTWLTAGIEILEQNASYLRTLSSLSHEDKRIEERILLWKILRVFIENEGLLEGNPVVEKAVRAVLSPGLDDENSAEAPLYATGAELSGISQSLTSAPRAEAVDPAAVDQLRKHLLRGDRQKAVWDAVDKRLWAHALLISNTVSKDLYKQVAQEFVQKEVKNIGDNTEPLAALYEIFAGNFEESIDELVPPSARAGFQMVSTSSTAGPSKDALDGLDRWRETLGLVLSNRSTDDTQALNALGKLLSGYGRAEAAHICFLFARSLSLFGGIDSPGTSFVLVGSDHLRQPFDFDRELEPILLSEVFEYGMTLSSVSTVAYSSPHLAVYKLQHAKILAEYGLRDKALQYSETVAAAITSQTKRSPYHHPLLVSELDDLSKRLKQSPKDGSGSWISKPSIDKAKGSVWATFNKFVAGDEAADATSEPGIASEVGPFARIAGGTPTISRSPSNGDIYGSYPGGSAMNGIAAKPSKYAPGAAFAPPNYDSQSAGSGGRSSMEERSSAEFQRYQPHQPQRQMSQMSDYRPSSQPIPINPNNQYAPQASSSYTPQSSYMPHANTASSYTPHTPITDQAPPSFQDSPQPLNNFDGPQQSSYTPQEYSRNSSASYEPPSTDSYAPPTSSGYEQPSSNGYEPPSSGYEPPAFVPYEPTDEPDSPVETRPKKKSFMDDDEDDIPALKEAPATREKTKAEKDREADEAFRRAAEADGKPYSLSPTKPISILVTKY